jgi:hypothetical protein
MRMMLILLLSLMSIPAHALSRHVYFGHNCTVNGGPVECGTWRVQVDNQATQYVNKTTEIYLNSVNGHRNNVVMIMSPTGDLHFYPYCGAYIIHTGVTGNLNLNDPVNGDITIDGAEY